MTKYLLLCLVAFAPAAHAQQAFCHEAWGIDQLTNDPYAAFAKIDQACHPGDRIAVSIRSTALLMMACDPNKPISTVGAEAICALPPAAAVAAPQLAAKKSRSMAQTGR